MSDSPSNASPRAAFTRRRLLGLLGAGTAGAAIVAATPGQAEAGHDATNVLHIGESNSAAAPTHLLANFPEPPADIPGLNVSVNFGRGVVARSDHGVGVLGLSAGGDDPAFPKIAVEGEAAGNGVGVRGRSMTDFDSGGFGSGAGVQGESGSGPAVLGDSQTGPGVNGNSITGLSDGVLGTSSFANALHGETESGTGVNAHSVSGVGALGHSDTGTGVLALTNTGTALDVAGPARFSTGGSGVIPHGHDSVAVPNDAVTDHSHVMVTLTGNPGPRTLQAVIRRPGVGFTVHLTHSARRPSTPFSYLIVEVG